MPARYYETITNTSFVLATGRRQVARKNTGSQAIQDEQPSPGMQWLVLPQVRISHSHQALERRHQYIFSEYRTHVHTFFLILVFNQENKVNMYERKNAFYFLITISIVWGLTKSTTAIPASYDQRQNGDFNVHIDVEDVQVVALLDKELLDDYTDYYAYDYADFTIKPIMKPTTTENSVTTGKPSSTAWPTNPSPSSSTSASVGTDTKSTPTTSDAISLVTVSSTPSVETDNASSTVADDSRIDSTTPKMDGTTKSDDNPETLSTNHPETTIKTSEKKCPSGTLRNGNGRCRKVNRRRMSIIPRLALKLAPKLGEDGASKGLRVVSWMSPSS